MLSEKMGEAVAKTAEPARPEVEALRLKVQREVSAKLNGGPSPKA
jgi:hypothetical protein